MMRHSKPLPIAIAICVLLIVLFASITLYRARRDRAIAFFSSALQESVVPPISIGNATYRVEGGRVSDASGASVSPGTSAKVLEIAYAVVLSRHDPIFAVDGTDPGSLAQAVAALKASVPDIADRYEGADREEISRAIYPIDFLSSLTDLQQTRDSFLATPSENELVLYRAGLVRTDMFYGQDLDVFQNALSDVLPEKSGVVFVDGVLDRAGYLSLLAKAGSSSAQESTRVRNFISCTNGDVGDCESLEFPALPEVTSQAAPSLQQDASDEEIFLKAGILQPQTGEPDRVLLSEDPCTTGGSASVYAVRMQKENGIQATQLTDIFFWDFSKVSTPSPYVQALEAKGFRYLFQPPSNPYACWSGSDNFVDIASMIDIRDIVAEDPVFASTQGSSPALVQNARVLEGNIVSANTLREADVAAYMQDVQTYLSTYGESGFSQRFGEKKLFEAEELLSVWRNKSGNFDAVVRTVIYFNRITTAASGNAALPAFQILALRTMPRLVFLFDNPSVANFPLEIPNSVNDLSSGVLVSYWRDLYPKISPATAIQMIENSVATYQQGPQSTKTQ